MTIATSSAFSVSHASRSPKSQGFAKHYFATAHHGRTGTKVSSNPKTSSIALTVSVTPSLIVALASQVTKGSLNNFPDPLGPISTVIKQHLLSLLVATFQKSVLAGENRIGSQ